MILGFEISLNYQICKIFKWKKFQQTVEKVNGRFLLWISTEDKTATVPLGPPESLLINNFNSSVLFTGNVIVDGVNWSLGGNNSWKNSCEMFFTFYKIWN